ncbi:hypothetical protein JYU34_012037 [Plutella xylostella]|uniref:Uncharacterized protein n=1 Tax=Plutella xylostella TaxID=51655 RepID=A0ABQ7QE78_PLUXY|nr:hypothetical protein JYU34_012037 [Plutella xylostella]
MYRNVAIIVFVLMVDPSPVAAPPPLRLTIDCGTEDDADSPSGRSSFHRSPSIFGNDFDVNSFCQLIHNSIPKAVKDGKFMIKEESDMDQSGFADTLMPIAIAPPQGFPIPRLNLPRLRLPRLRVPRINVPRLLPQLEGPMAPPRLVSTMSIPRLREVEEETSAEKMEKFKKGVQKMLHVVKVLGQVDQYLSERTRIVVDKLSKTFAE